MPIIEQVVNGVLGIAFYPDPPAPAYRSQSVLVGVVRMLRRARDYSRRGDLVEAVRALTHAHYCRGLVAVDTRERPSTLRADRLAGKVELEILDRIGKETRR